MGDEFLWEDGFERVKVIERAFSVVWVLDF